MIVCWFDDLMWNCCVWFLFFSLTNDVSTFQKDEYCKNHLMNELIDSKTKKSFIDWLTDSKNKKVDYWLNVDWFRRTRKSTIDCHFRKLTIIFADSRCWRFFFKHSRISTNDKNIVSTRFFYEHLTIFF